MNSRIAFLAASAFLLPQLSFAAEQHPDPTRARVFKLDFKQVATSDNSGGIMDSGFMLPGAAAVYWYKSSGGQPELYVAPLPQGKVRDLTSLMPSDKLPDAVAWSSDGWSLAFADGTTLDVIAVSDGTRRLVSTAPWAFAGREIYWQDGKHILAGCTDGSQSQVCQLDLTTGKVVASDPLRFAEGLPEVEGYFPSQDSFLIDYFGPESGSAVFLAKFGDLRATPQRIAFPELDAESGISATADGKYMVTDTLMQVGDPREGKVQSVLLMGNIRTDRWARIEVPRPNGESGISCKIASDGKWLEILVVRGTSVDSLDHLYVARLPQPLFDYLDSRP